MTPEEFVARLVSVQGSLRGYILAHVSDLHLADDILQEVSVALWRKLPEYEAARPFLRWALGIAHKEILRSRRSAVRSRLLLDPEISERLAERYALLEAELQQRRSALERCLARLPEPARALVDARYLEARPIRDIAARLGRSIGAVQMQLSRIRSILADCVRRRLQDPAGEGSP